jgi:tRNA(Ile)-lysidine synthase
MDDELRKRGTDATPVSAAAPVSAAEAKTLFAGLSAAPALVLAVSGGPDSTALMVLAARWRAALKSGPELLAVTIDHGLRRESAREARAVKRLAVRLGLRHRTLRWTGAKPKTGLQEAARAVRYRLLVAAARGAGASHVLTAHTLDDQAETVLFRMARGSGLTGLCAMMREAPLAGAILVRPLLDVPKVRLIATLDSVGLSFADDPSNRDPRFTRARLRALMPGLAGEGLDAGRLALLARRLRRAEAAIEVATAAAASAVSEGAWSERGPIVLDAQKFHRLPAEVALRLLGRAITCRGGEGPVQLAKLEALCEALAEATAPESPRLRRTLAGALVTQAGGRLTIERAPPRAAKWAAKAPHGRRPLTTGRYRRPRPLKRRYN